MDCRPGTAQARFNDIKAEWNAATRVEHTGTRRQQRAQSAQARSRLQALETELLQMSRAGAPSPGRGGQRGRSARSPAALQDESASSQGAGFRRDDLGRRGGADHAWAVRLPNAVDDDDPAPLSQNVHCSLDSQPKSRRTTQLSPLKKGSEADQAGHRQSKRGNLIAGQPQRGSLASMSSGGHLRRGSLASMSSRASSALPSPYGEERRDKGHIPDGRPASSYGGSAFGGSHSRPGSRYAQREFGLRDLPPPELGGWVAYDDIRKIIKEETTAAVKEIKERPRSPSILRNAADVRPRNDHPVTTEDSPVKPAPDLHRAQASPAKDHHARSRTSSPTGGIMPLTDRSTGEIPRFFSDGRMNPYFLLRQEMPISMTILGFFGFSRHSSIRSKCVLMLNDTSWQMFFILCAVVNSIYISIQPELDLDSLDSTSKMMMEMLDFVFLGVFYLEVLAGCVAYGFRGTPSAWFNRDFFNRLDFFILIVSVYEQTTRYFNLAGFTLLPLRLLRVIKVMTGLQHFASVKAVLITLGEGAEQLAVVFGILVAFTAIFSVFGMGVFRGSFSR